MKKVSIIIPSYNVENFIEKCISSLLKQTYNNIEIIVVNDGSKDNTGKIVKSIADNNSNVLYYEKENGGASSARNYGIDKATGDYILFVDSDDYVNDEYVESLVNCIKEDDSFALATNIEIEKEDGWKKYELSNEISTFFRYPSVCIRLYNKKYIDEINLRFSKSSHGEDLEFTSKLFIYNNKCSIADNSTYYYVYNDKSATRTNDEHFISIMDSLEGIETFAKENNKYEENYSVIEFIYILHVLYYLVKTLKTVESVSNERINDIINKVNKKFPNWKNNKYIKDLKYNEIEFLRETYK